MDVSKIGWGDSSGTG